MDLEQASPATWVDVRPVEACDRGDFVVEAACAHSVLEPPHAGGAIHRGVDVGAECVQLERELAERKAEEKRRKEAQARAMDANTGAGGTTDNPGVTNPNTNTNTTQPATGNTNNNTKKTYRTARAIPGKPGYVFNPWTLEPVDVRGIPSGSLVQDPNDPNKANHRFRVP